MKNATHTPTIKDARRRNFRVEENIFIFLDYVKEVDTVKR